MDYQKEYRQKLVTPQEAVKAVKSGDWVDYTVALGFPPLLDQALAERRDELSDVKIRGNLIFGPIKTVECDPKREHVVYSSFTNFPKIDRYINTGRLIRLRNSILVNMDFKRQTISHHEEIYVPYDIQAYKDVIRNRWDIWDNKPIKNASEFCYVLRRIVNSNEERQQAVIEIVEKRPRAIIFYNFDYELEILKSLYYGEDVEIAEWNGHKHQPIPDCDKWIYLVQYNAGAEGWNCIKTDTIIFYSQNYSYKIMVQSSGRIDRLNTPYTDLYYYHLKSRSGIDLAISKALHNKKKFNETGFYQKKGV